MPEHRVSLTCRNTHKPFSSKRHFKTLQYSAQRIPFCVVNDPLGSLDCGSEGIVHTVRGHDLLSHNPLKISLSVNGSRCAINLGAHRFQSNERSIILVLMLQLYGPMWLIYFSHLASSLIFIWQQILFQIQHDISCLYLLTIICKLVLHYLRL